MKKITVLGNFSGRNAGDNAILGNLLEDISEKLPDVKFLVPTWSKNFVEKHFSTYNIEAMGLKPWNFAFKIFGYPTYKAMTDTDLILITDNILFDRKYYNPLFNYLSTIGLFSPAAHKKGIPILPYNASLGPITTEKGRKAMQKILDASPYLSVRDQQSKDMLDRNNLKYSKIIDGADCAINTPILDDSEIENIINHEGLFKNSNGTLSFNINAYIDSWQKIVQGGEEFGREKFVELISKTIDTIIEELKIDIMFTVTQVMDLTITNEVLAKVKNIDKIRVIPNAKYTYQEITSLLSKCGLHIGMRTHSLILASAAFTPMITINAYPKSGGYVKTIGQGDWIINFEDMNHDNLVKVIKNGWENRKETREKMIPQVISEQKKAKEVVKLVVELLKEEQDFIMSVEIVEESKTGNFVDGNSIKNINTKYLSVAFSDKNLCARSGTCVAACPEKALKIGKDFYPEINEDKCTECGICNEICPGDKVNFKELTQITFGHDNNDDSFDGEVLKTFVGYCTDENIRGGGAGGGVITGLLWDLLKRNVVEGCIVTRMNPEKPYHGEVFIARTYEELLESQQSKYIVIPVNSILKEVKDLPGKYAMAALPCQIHGFRLMEKLGDPVTEKIEVLIGLFCAAAMEPFVALEMMKMKNVDPNEITNFNFREGSWPGHIRATLKTGQKVNMHYSNFKDGAINYMTQLYSPFRCQTCIDGSSEFSDISVSDAWTRDESGKYIFQSQSKLLVRTEKGLNVLNNSVAAGTLEVEDVTQNKHYKTHKLHRRKKGLKTPLRVERLKKKGIPVPQYDKEVPRASIREKIEERLETFVMTCGHYKIIRYPLYKFLTSKLGVPFIKLRQYNKSKKYRRK